MPDPRRARDDLGFGPEVVRRLLPHRPPLLLVQHVVRYVPGDRVEARTHVDPGEPVLAGHFPGRPIWPGVYTLEALAQTAGVLLGLEEACRRTDGGWPAVRAALQCDPPVGDERIAGVTGVLVAADVKWRRVVEPGDTLELAAFHVRSALGMVQVDVEARVGAERAANGRLTVAPGPSAG